MKYAISTDNGFVSEHFGRCPEFTIIDIINGKKSNVVKVDNPGHSPGLIPQFLNEKDVDFIITGGMGARAQMLFDEYGIKAILGITGKIEDVINQIEQDVLTGGISLCSPGAGKGYGLDKDQCDHGGEGHNH